MACNRRDRAGGRGVGCADGGDDVRGALIALLGAAAGGSEDLDKAIGAVTGRGYHEQPCLGIYNYTRSLDAAVSLVPRGLEWEVNCFKTPRAKGAEAQIYLKPFWRSRDDDPDARIICDAATPALALCIAALKATGQ